MWKALVICFVSWNPGLLLAYGESTHGLPIDRPLIIAHRGSSGMLPEHTVEAYQLAVEQGADVIECDLAVTKDQMLVCTHDAWLNATTNVAMIPEFKDRVNTYRIDGVKRTDYFTVDFTLEELKQLRKIQVRSYRDQSYNYKFAMASFDEYVAVAKNKSNEKMIGIYPETKNPEFFNTFLQPNTTMEDILLESLHKHGYIDNLLPCFIQSFSEDSLRYLSNRTSLSLVFLTATALTEQRLEEISQFCYGLGPSKNTIVTVNPTTNRIIGTTNFLAKAHSYGLKLHPYTFRNEYLFLAWDYGSDPYREYEKFLELGIDGYFTDFPWSLANFLNMKRTNNAVMLTPFGIIEMILLTGCATLIF